MENTLFVSSSPHFRGGRRTSHIMACVLLCLLPSVVASAVIFGARALLVIAVCASVCTVTEFLCRLIMKRVQTVNDLSAAVTGVLLALTLPPDIPLPFAVFGCVCAIAVIKQMFGGIGCNFINPALGARIIMLMSFPGAMTSFTYDGATTATPLAAHHGISELLLGNTGGCIGETCSIAIIVGGCALMLLRVIRPVIPVFYITTVAVFSAFAGRDVMTQVFGGGLLLGAFFMATDYTTSPLTDVGKLVYAVGCGLLTCVIRFYASLPEGVSYAIVLMNIAAPLIDRVTAPKPFGERERRRKEAGK